jgi:hypothetical protein
MFGEDMLDIKGCLRVAFFYGRVGEELCIKKNILTFVFIRRDNEV